MPNKTVGRSENPGKDGFISYQNHHKHQQYSEPGEAVTFDRPDFISNLADPGILIVSKIWSE